MAEWAVVAIPADDNPIWRISSEKIPHMTLLYFGEQSDGEKATRVAEYLQHMVENTMVRFGLEVDFRGTLGPKDADVLFFHEDRSLRNVQDYRAHMLKDPDMFEMYHAIEQYPEWTAHLTLGYPDAPANPPDKDMPPGWSPGYVHFDRIALWTEDFEGIEFQIPWNKGMDLDVAWSALRHAQFTKEARKSLAEDKKAMSDGSFPIRNVADLKNAIQAYGRAKNKDKAKAWIKKRAKALQAESYLPEEWMTDTAAQSDPVGEFIASLGEPSADEIKHYGRKGQKWGIRRTQEQLDADSEDVTNVKTARAKIKANRTTDVLTNKELQQVVTRLNLEQQYSNLTTPKNKEMFKGENFIKDLVKTGKTVNDAVNTVSTLQNNLGPLIRDAASAASKRASHSDSARKKKVSTGSLKKSEVRRKNKNPYSGPIGTM